MTKKFYQELSEELKAGGVEAFYDYLLNVDLTGFDEGTQPPMTEAKKRLIDLSAGSEIRFAFDWIEGETGLPVCPCKSPDLYEAYQAYCRRNGESRPRTAAQFFSQLTHHGFKKKKARIYESAHSTQSIPANILFPPDENISAKPANETDTAWLTRCCKKFNEALLDGKNHNERMAA